MNPTSSIIGAGALPAKPLNVGPAAILALSSAVGNLAIIYTPTRITPGGILSLHCLGFLKAAVLFLPGIACGLFC